MAENIRNILQGIGLTKEQVEVYLAGLELGEASVQNLAKKANIKRPTTYLILDELKAKGLFSQVLKGKKKIFSSRRPGKIVYQHQTKRNTAQANYA